MPKPIAQLISEARKALIAADIDGSALDARLLLQAATHLCHEDIVANPDFSPSAEQTALFEILLKRRLDHEPVSRILGLREFYGRDFLVTPAVLDPRADTETLIDMALKLGAAHQILDIGTGSGAIVVTLLAEMPLAHGWAVDISQDALHVAKKNALRHGVSGRIQFQRSSWFEGVQGKFDRIVSNPPYIPHEVIATLASDVKDYDPHLALDGGGDGLFAYRALAAGAMNHLADRGLVIVEIGAGQANDVTEIFSRHQFKLKKQQSDLGGHVRGLAFQAC